MSTPTSVTTEPDLTPVPKVANPAIATGFITLLTTILAASDNQPFIDHNAWVVPLVAGIIGAIQFTIGYFSPRR